MHLLSTVNRLSKSEGNVPVSMFVYGGERKFLRVFEDYVVCPRLYCVCIEFPTLFFWVLDELIGNDAERNACVQDRTRCRL